MLNLKKLLTKVLNGMVRVRDVTFTGTYTIGASGYVLLGTVLPNNTIVSMMVHTWGSSTNAFSLAGGAGNAIYLVGTPNTSVTNIGITVLYL